jgi:hypothetical protein
MSDDYWAKKEEVQRRVKKLASQNVFTGAPNKPLPCDDMSTYQIEDCRKCPRPCNEPDVPLGESDEDSAE